MRIVKASAEIVSFTPDLELVIERAGRKCYKSEGLIAPGSAEKLIKKLLDSMHESVLEHGAITVDFVNDRGVSHEEVRHRLCSFSQESTRFCNYSKDKFGNSITYVDIKGGFPEAQEDWMQIWFEACAAAEEHYFRLIAAGAPAQFARSVLNNSTKTELAWTANPREWRWIFIKRTAKAAHPQIREVMIPLLHEFQKRWPCLYSDIKEMQ